MSYSSTLPTWASDIVSSPPARGAGLNRWLMRASIALRKCGRNDIDITQELYVLTAGEPIKRGEIERAVNRSVEYTNNVVATTPKKTWPDIDADLREQIIGEMDGIGEADLWEASPRRLIDESLDAEGFIDLLFDADSLVCCANKLYDAETAPREDWRGKLAAMQFVVPSPMSALRGLTQDGKSSARCLGNTGPRRFFVAEQDIGTPDEQARVLLHLAQRAPLAMVAHSGRKSLHGWFSCDGASEFRQRSFFNRACKLGADPATGTPCQMVRMPGGLRNNGKRQHVLFINPEVLR